MSTQELTALAFCVFLSSLFVSCGSNSTSNISNSGTQGAGGSSNNSSGQATVSVTLSDPSVCGASQGGPFQHIYITVTDVQIFPAASLPLQNGFDLTPSLNTNPMQIDLLGSPGANCALAILGTSAAVPPGKYHAVQISLAGVDQISAIKNGTKCPMTPSGLAANCVVLNNGSAIDLDQASTGSFQVEAGIAANDFELSAGAQRLNIDFDSCASMLFVYGNEYGMDPVLHAAIMPTAGTITGKLLDATTRQAIIGDVIVALEQADSNGVDRELMQASTAPDGSFVLCPVPPGTYDIVATAVSETGISYTATVTTAVQPGSSLGVVPLQAVSGASHTLAILSGQITATGPMPPLGGYTHVVISALQSIAVNGTIRLVTIPLPTQYTSALRTFVTDTATFELYVPAGNLLIGSFASNQSTTYEQSTIPGTYQIDTQSSCNPSVVRTAPVGVSAGKTSAVPAIALLGCPAA